MITFKPNSPVNGKRFSKYHYSSLRIFHKNVYSYIIWLRREKITTHFTLHVHPTCASAMLQEKQVVNRTYNSHSSKENDSENQRSFTVSHTSKKTKSKLYSTSTSMKQLSCRLKSPHKSKPTS